jgi:hypothetical protein
VFDSKFNMRAYKKIKCVAESGLTAIQAVHAAIRAEAADEFATMVVLY